MWKDIEFNVNYEISSEGIVRRKQNKNVLKGCITSGYRSVKLTFDNSKQKQQQNTPAKYSLLLLLLCIFSFVSFWYFPSLVISIFRILLSNILCMKSLSFFVIPSLVLWEGEKKERKRKYKKKAGPKRPRRRLATRGQPSSIALAMSQGWVKRAVPVGLNWNEQREVSAFTVTVISEWARCRAGFASALIILKIGK